MKITEAYFRQLQKNWASRQIQEFENSPRS